MVNGGAITKAKNFPANVKRCNNCGIVGHLAKKCRKPKKSQAQTSKPPQTNFNQIDTNATKSDNEKSVNYITSYQELYNQVYDSNYDSDFDDYEAAISSDSANQIEHLNAKTQYRNIVAHSRINSGSVCSLITKKTS